MTTEYKAYAIGSLVYCAIEGEASKHYAIVPAIVDSVYFTNNSVEYGLVGVESKNDFGDFFDEKLVSDDFNKLIEFVKSEWESIELYK